jgi:hypothetical protein
MPYNFCIMLKWLAIAAGAVVIVAGILATTYYQNYYGASKGYDVQCTQPSQPGAVPAFLACKIYPVQDIGHGHFSPHWWDVLIAWPEGITAWLLMLTMVGIIWQAWETRKTAEAANRGIELTKTKDRAKLLLSPQALNPTVGTIPEAKLFVTNVGNSNAIVGIAFAGLHISDSDALVENGAGWYDMKVGNRLLEPKEVIEETVWWPAHPFARYSQDVIEDQEVIHLHGIIRFRDDYGDPWGVNFHFIWRSYGVPVWFPHLQAHKYGDWDDQDEKGEYRMAKEGKPRWWKFWVKAAPSPKRHGPNPN